MDPKDIDLIALVTLAAPSVSDRVIAHLKAEGFEGVKASHGYVIQRLLDAEPTIGELGAVLGITQQGASKQVSDLERLGYVERVAVDGDQRARRVRLTPRGHAMVDAARRARRVLEESLVDQVGARRAAAARSALTALVEQLGLSEGVKRRSIRPPTD